MIRLLPVSGLEDPALDFFTKYSEVQLKRLYEPDGGLFIAESPKVILRALEAGCVPVSLLLEERHVNGEAREVLARCSEMSARCTAPPGKGGLPAGELPAYTGPYEVLTKLTGYALTRGVLCAMRRPPLRSVEEVLREAQGRRQAAAAGRHGSGSCAGIRIAVLENVMNPANVGAIFRNAAALGMDAVLLTDGCSDPLYRRTLRVSMGTALQIPWAWIGKNLEEWRDGGLGALKEKGFRTIAMALREDAVPIRELKVPGEEKAAVILGAEGDGLLPQTIAGADSVVMIPMMRGVDSLNVAAASAIAFHAFCG